MREFSQLLDGLVYTRSRNGKLKLIGDLSEAHADPDRGLCAGGADGRTRPAGSQARGDPRIVEERIDPVLFNMSWDYVGDMPNGVAALAQEVRSADEIDDGCLRIGSGGRSDCRGLGRARRRRRGACRHARPSRCVGPLCPAQARDGRTADRRFARLAKTGAGHAFGLDVDAVEEVWHGIGPPYCRSSPGRREGRAADFRQTCPVFRPFMLAHPLDDLRCRWRTMQPSGNGTGSGSRSSASEGRPGSTAAPATTSREASPSGAESFLCEGVVDGELL
jgi:DNA ligase-1